MTKGQTRGNRETKKPKSVKEKTPSAYKSTQTAETAIRKVGAGPAKKSR